MKTILVVTIFLKFLCGWCQVSTMKYKGNLQCAPSTCIMKPILCHPIRISKIFKNSDGANSIQDCLLIDAPKSWRKLVYNSGRQVGLLGLVNGVYCGSSNFLLFSPEIFLPPPPWYVPQLDNIGILVETSLCLLNPPVWLFMFPFQFVSFYMSIKLKWWNNSDMPTDHPCTYNYYWNFTTHTHACSQDW